MRIGIDASFAAFEWRGVGKYVVHLVNGLVRADTENTYIIYGPRTAFPSISGRKNAVLLDFTHLPFPLWEQAVLPLRVLWDGLDILHCPVNTAPLFLSHKVRLVVSIHDVMYLLPASVLPGARSFRQRLGNIYRRMFVPWAARRADRIVTVSEFSRTQIIERLAVDPAKVHVTYEGVEPHTSPPADLCTVLSRFEGYPLDRGYVLALGASDPRKNTDTVIRVYADVRRRRLIDEVLVIVGLHKWCSWPFYRLALDLGIAEDVFFTDYVPQEKMNCLYQSARCLLYPSLYEGFGFPPLEAMSWGTPVITSNVASIPEVVGDAALLVDPRSSEAIKEALLRVLQDDELRNTLVERGYVQWQKFAWKEAVRRTFAVYAGLAADRRQRVDLSE